jgi:hypothetical protein
MITRTVLILTLQTFVLILLLSTPGRAELFLGPEELVEAGGAVIEVPGYSVPSFTHWDDDGLKDLIVGEGGGVATDGKVRVYLNTGTASDPNFGDYFYAQSEGADLVRPGEG